MKLFQTTRSKRSLRLQPVMAKIYLETISTLIWLKRLFDSYDKDRNIVPSLYFGYS